MIDSDCEPLGRSLFWTNSLVVNPYRCFCFLHFVLLIKVVSAPLPWRPEGSHVRYLEEISRDAIRRGSVLIGYLGFSTLGFPQQLSWQLAADFSVDLRGMPGNTLVVLARCQGFCANTAVSKYFPEVRR